jgi:hypothetical protein
MIGHGATVGMSGQAGPGCESDHILDLAAYAQAIWARLVIVMPPFFDDDLGLLDIVAV